MNYRHAYHAGNFAYVLKHVVLKMLLEHRTRQPSPFFLLYTHARPRQNDLTFAVLFAQPCGLSIGARLTELIVGSYSQRHALAQHTRTKATCYYKTDIGS